MSNSTKVALIVLACLLIPAILFFGLIALIAVPNLSGIRTRAQVSADKRTAETIGKAVRIWVTDIYDENGQKIERELPDDPVEYSEIEGLCPAYISSGYTARSLNRKTGSYYVSYYTYPDDEHQKICVYIGNEKQSKPESSVNVFYDGSRSDWAYVEK